MPRNKRKYEWAGPNFSHEYEPPDDEAKQMVRLYHTAVAQHSFSLLFTYMDTSASVDDLNA